MSTRTPETQIFRGLKREEEKIVLSIAAKMGEKFNIPNSFFKYETLLMRKNDGTIPIVPHHCILVDAHEEYINHKERFALS